MSQQRQSTQGAQNSANQLLTLPGYSNGLNDLGNVKGPKRPWWRRRGVIIGFVLVVLVVLVGGFVYTKVGSPAPVTYQYQQVAQGDLALTVSATGPLQSPATYNLVATGTGKINAIDVKVGQRVNKGQVLAQLDTVALQDAVNQAQASVNADQDALYTTEVNANWFITPAVTQAKDTLKIAQAQLDTAQHALDAATIKAPHVGVVTAINGTIGGSPGAGTSASGTSGSNYFIQIVDLSSLQVQANVNESDTANLKIGDAVTFTVNAYGDRQFKGAVSAISASGVTTSNVVSYPVNIDVDMKSAKGANLLPGMTASVAITVVQHHNVLLVPVNAINFAHLASGGNGGNGSSALISQQDANVAMSQARQMLKNLESQDATLAQVNPVPAYVIEKTNRGAYVAKPVVLGLTDNTSYEVLQGLSAGDTFITGTGGSGSGTNAPSGSSSKGG
jgi:HlyD family secretion protein